MLIRLLFAFLVTNIAFAQHHPEQVPQQRQQSGFGQIDFLSIDMPLSPEGLQEPNMGMSGLHYNLNFGNFYTGLGIYGSLTGQRGGFFTLGLNTGLKKHLTDLLFIDTGLHFGGGGGAAAPDGGGAFILPHVNLGFQFKPFSLTLGYSYINFIDKGQIESHQLHFGMQIPLDFDYATFDHLEKNYTSAAFKDTPWNTPSKRISFMLHLNNLNVSKNSTIAKVSSLADTTIRLAGLEIDAYLDKNWFVFFKADGAYSGIPAGYMDIFLGGGYHFSFNNDTTNLLTKFGMGAGGGGGVDTEGGFMIYPDLSLEQRLFDDMYISINKGFMLTPDSHFSSSTYGLGIKYYANFNGTENKPKSRLSKFKGFEAILKQEVYLNAQRTSNPTENLYQISFQLNYFLNKTFYLAGQTSFANFGNAGAYAEGIAGLGLQTPSFLGDNLQLFGQFLGGGAGGGNISTGQGFIVKPAAGFNLKLSNTLSLRSSVGYTKALRGDLASAFGNIGLSYKLAFLNAK